MAKPNPFRKPVNAGLADHVVVVGLGRFGQSVALELMASGSDVLGIDIKEDLVQLLNGRLTHVVRADATQEEVLRQLGVDEAAHVVIGIGDSIEASLLVTSMVLSLGVPEVWAKAVSDAHGRILSQIGVTHVIHPERESGKRVAHQVRAQVLDYIELGGGYALVRTTPPASVTGRPIREVHIRRSHGVTVIATKTRGGDWKDVTGDTVLQPTDEVLLTGPIAKAERFHFT